MHIHPYHDILDAIRRNQSFMPPVGRIEFIPFDGSVALTEFASEFETDDLPEGVRVEQSEDGDTITILVDVVGRGEKDVRVYTEEGVLFVSADPAARTQRSDVDVLEDRSRMNDTVDFEWELDDHWKVSNVSCENGVVEVVLERDVPEELRRIDYMAVPAIESEASA